MLLDNNNLGPFIFTFLPALVYAIMIYFNSGCKTIEIKKVFLYFTIGIVGIFLVSDLFPFIFPQWRYRIEGNEMVALFTFTMIQIALLEEFFKFTTFKIANMLNKEEEPMATMFYCICVSCGFGVAENLIYALSMGTHVLLIRAFTAIPMHILFGTTMGYFIALGRMNPKETDRLTKMLKRIGYTTIGILAATFEHGIYDFNAFIGSATMDKTWWLVIFGVAGIYAMLKDLKMKSQMINSNSSN